MKKLCTAALIAALCFVLLLPATAFAASASGSSDGVTATLSTPEDTYAYGEKIPVNVTLTNTNSYPITGVAVEITAPDGMTVTGGSGTWDLAAGETVTLRSKIAETAPKTDDGTGMALFAVIAAASGTAVVLLLKKRILRGRGLLALVLCLVLAGGVLLPAAAAGATFWDQYSNNFTAELAVTPENGGQLYRIGSVGSTASLSNAAAGGVSLGNITASIGFNIPDSVTSISGLTAVATVRNYNLDTHKTINRISSGTFRVGSTVYLYGGELYANISQINWNAQSPGNSFAAMRNAGTTCTDGNGNDVPLTESSHIYTDSSGGRRTGTCYSFTMPSSGAIVSHNYVALVWNVTTSVSGPGTISPSGSVSVADGESQTFTLTPALGGGCELQQILIDGNAVDAAALATAQQTGSYTLTKVHKDTRFEADFGKKTFTVTAQAGAGGTVSPSGSTAVAYGGSQTYTFTPETGYELAAVSIDGQDCDAGMLGQIRSSGTYAFSNVTAGHTIGAVFRKQTFTVTVSAGTGGTVTPSGSITVTYGADQPFTIAAGTGYDIGTVTLDGVDVTNRTIFNYDLGTGTYTLANVTADHTLAVTFVQPT